VAAQKQTGGSTDPLLLFRALDQRQLIVFKEGTWGVIKDKRGTGTENMSRQQEMSVRPVRSDVPKQ
jgi:hypothetical protein